jgi:ankyrin repeat protein
MSIQHLILCSFGEGGTRIPMDICEYYMINHRITEDDIRNLSRGSGLDYILNGQNPDKYKIAEVFISKGLSVNGVNHNSENGITPLHAAVLDNDPERTRFLLDQGADTSIVSEGYGMTPLELAEKLDKTGSEDRNRIIEMLSQHEIENTSEERLDSG